MYRCPILQRHVIFPWRASGSCEDTHDAYLRGSSFLSWGSHDWTADRDLHR